MERDGARQYHALKAELEEAVREAEAGGFETFDPVEYEPAAKPQCSIRQREENQKIIFFDNFS